MAVCNRCGSCVASGVQGKAPDGGVGAKLPETDDAFVKICYFEPFLRCMHDYANRFNIKLKPNQFGGRKVVRQATIGYLPPILPIGHEKWASPAPAQ